VNISLQFQNYDCNIKNINTIKQTILIKFHTSRGKIRMWFAFYYISCKASTKINYQKVLSITV